MTARRAAPGAGALQLLQILPGIRVHAAPPERAEPLFCGEGTDLRGHFTSDHSGRLPACSFAPQPVAFATFTSRDAAIAAQDRLQVRPPPEPGGVALARARLKTPVPAGEGVRPALARADAPGVCQVQLEAAGPDSPRPPPARRRAPLRQAAATLRGRAVPLRLRLRCVRATEGPERRPARPDAARRVSSPALVNGGGSTQFTRAPSRARHLHPLPTASHTGCRQHAHRTCPAPAAPSTGYAQHAPQYGSQYPAARYECVRAPRRAPCTSAPRLARVAGIKAAT